MSGPNALGAFPRKHTSVQGLREKHLRKAQSREATYGLNPDFPQFPCGVFSFLEPDPHPKRLQVIH